MSFERKRGTRKIEWKVNVNVNVNANVMERNVTKVTTF